MAPEGFFMSFLISPDLLAIVTLWQEARGEQFNGKCAVGEVIRNRIAYRYASDGTIAGTVLRPSQFSGWNPGDPNRIASLKLDDLDPMVIECARAWKESASSNYAKGAVLYCNLAICIPRPGWAKKEKNVAVIGAHSFFIDS
jgi:spore germination cell wall hydrolase CwlJ-like protein